jgi:hypothetical protein
MGRKEQADVVIVMISLPQIHDSDTPFCSRYSPTTDLTRVVRKDVSS